MLRVGYLVQLRVLVLLQFLEQLPDVRHLLLCDSHEERSQVEQTGVFRLRDPGVNEYSVVWLQLKVFCDVVDYNGLAQIATQSGQILDVEPIVRQCMLPVQPMRDILLVVHEAQSPVSILLGACSENDQFKVLRHQLQERVCARSDR